jgi:2-polyprenyl-3-methyl-5-hydroxy-6-metoxy-1,4-benzoquinol methylase/glycosyltransferase involved in cell wall biosynthesis
MKIAYFSPLGPQRSGISDYSEELLPHLAAGAEITLFVEGFVPLNRDLTSRFEVLDYRRQRSHLRQLDRFDAVLYHMGNDHRYHSGIFEVMKQHRGIVVFHDFALQDFFLGLARDRNDITLYLNEIEACHGKQARLDAAKTLAVGGTPSIVFQPIEFPLNRKIAELAEGIIVHSEWSRKRFESSVPNIPIAHIAHLAKLPDAGSQTPGPNKVVNIATFGLITPGKGIEPSLRALSRLKAKHSFQYTLVGDTNQFFEVREIVRRYDMQDCVEITGHISLDEFKRRIDETDIALNIRERTVGETSGCLVRLLAAGICSVVADEGWYAELPSDSVVKIPLDSTTDQMLVAYLDRLLADKPLRDRIGKNARTYALEEFRAEHRAADYLEFIRRIIAGRPRRQLVKSVSDELSNLHVPPTDDSFLLSVAEDIAVLVGDETAEVVAQSTSPNQPATTQSKQLTASQHPPSNGRLSIPDGIDYKHAAIDYVDQLDAERSYYLRTKPFYNLANKPDKHHGEGMDAETHRHFCDFANIAVTLALLPGSKILDVGCGSGWLSEYFGRLGYQVTGIDISPKLIEMSRERVSQVPYDVDHETAISCVFKVHDIEDGPLAEKFDAVICYDSLHHFQDENAVMRNIAAMLPVGGVMFVLEGDRPPVGSATETELVQVMKKYGTLESPFDYLHLRQILDEYGFTVIGDYTSVNGLFERESIVDDQLPLKNIATNYHYLVCKKIADGAAASTVPDSLHPNLLQARITLLKRGPQELKTGETLKVECEIENMGDTLWLAGSEIRTGVVMPGVKVIDDNGRIVKEFHGEPPLPRAVAPGEAVRVRIALEVLFASGRYTLKLDLVNQHICWFEEVGSQPLTIKFEVI